MTKKPETKLSTQVLSRLRAEGGWWVKIHGGPFQAAGIPDIIGCWQGRFIGIELKIPGEKPTGLQEKVLNALYSSGARVGIAYTVKEALLIREGKNNFSLFENRG